MKKIKAILFFSIIFAVFFFPSITREADSLELQSLSAKKASPISRIDKKVVARTKITIQKTGEREVLRATSLGVELAQRAEKVARKKNSYGNCYYAVANQVIYPLMGVSLWGRKASTAKRLLSSEENKKYFKEIDINQIGFNSLPIGTVVVWGWSPSSGNTGHISVVIGRDIEGNLLEASDHITIQRTEKDGYRHPKLFIPIKKKI